MLEKFKQLFKSRAQKEAEQRLARIDAVMQWHGGRLAIYKRIDENRELLEFLKRKAPQLLEECPWLVWWIASILSSRN